MNVPVRNAAGKVCGEIVDTVLRKKARGSVHQLQTPRGWAWDAAILRQARAAGCERTEVIDTEVGAVYSAALAAFERHGVAINRGAGEQICLPLGFWRIERADGPRQLTLGLEGAP